MCWWTHRANTLCVIRFVFSPLGVHMIYRISQSLRKNQTDWVISSGVLSQRKYPLIKIDMRSADIARYDTDSYFSVLAEVLSRFNAAIDSEQHCRVIPLSNVDRETNFILFYHRYFVQNGGDDYTRRLFWIQIFSRFNIGFNTLSTARFREILRSFWIRSSGHQNSIKNHNS